MEQIPIPMREIQPHPKLPKPRIRVRPAGARGTKKWMCSHIGATLYVGFGDTPRAAYQAWMKFHK